MDTSWGGERGLPGRVQPLIVPDGDSPSEPTRRCRRRSRRRLGSTTVAGVRSEEVEVATGSDEAVHDLTSICEEFLAGEDGDGLLHLWVPHATAGLAILETGAGSDRDLLAVLRDLLPPDDRYRHRHGSRGHGRDHVLPALLPPFATVPVISGEMTLGTWQSVCLVDTNVDNPVRRVRLSFVPG